MSSVAEIREWFEVPAIAHYCYLFRAAFDLTEFEIEVSALFGSVLLFQKSEILRQSDHQF